MSTQELLESTIGQPLTFDLPIVVEGYAVSTVKGAAAFWHVSRSTARNRLVAASLATTSKLVLHKGRFCSAEIVYLLPAGSFQD